MTPKAIARRTGSTLAIIAAFAVCVPASATVEEMSNLLRGDWGQGIEYAGKIQAAPSGTYTPCPQGSSTSKPYISVAQSADGLIMTLPALGKSRREDGEASGPLKLYEGKNGAYILFPPQPEMMSMTLTKVDQNTVRVDRISRGKMETFYLLRCKAT